jgi:hypothetical protein
VENATRRSRCNTASELQYELNILHGILVSVIQYLGLNKVWCLMHQRKNVRNSERLVPCSFCNSIPSFVKNFSKTLPQETRHGFTPYPENKTSRHGMKTLRSSAIKYEIFWQSTLGSQRRYAHGPDVIRRNKQCRDLACNIDTLTVTKRKRPELL